MIYTTGKRLKKHDACLKSFKKLIESIPNYTEKTKIPITYIIKSNGIVDAIWSLRAIYGKQQRKQIALEYAIACAKHVLPIFEAEYPTDNRPAKAINTATLKLIFDSPNKKNEADIADAAYAAADAAYAANVAGAYADYAAADAANAAVCAAYAAGAYAAADAAYAAADAADAAADAANAAVCAAANAAVCAAGRQKERAWQKTKLIEILKKYD